MTTERAPRGHHEHYYLQVLKTLGERVRRKSGLNCEQTTHNALSVKQFIRRVFVLVISKIKKRIKGNTR